MCVPCLRPRSDFASKFPKLTLVVYIVKSDESGWVVGGAVGYAIPGTAIAAAAWGTSDIHIRYVAPTCAHNDQGLYVNPFSSRLRPLSAYTYRTRKPAYLKGAGTVKTGSQPASISQTEGCWRLWLPHLGRTTAASASVFFTLHPTTRSRRRTPLMAATGKTAPSSGSVFLCQRWLLSQSRTLASTSRGAAAAEA